MSVCLAASSRPGRWRGSTLRRLLTVCIAPIPTLTNALPGLNGSYAGAIVGLYGTNLAVAHATPVITFNGVTATILYSSPSQINLQIPNGIPWGPEVMNLNNGALDAYPLTVNIDTPPATITSIQNSAGNMT